MKPNQTKWRASSKIHTKSASSAWNNKKKNQINWKRVLTVFVPTTDQRKLLVVENSLGRKKTSPAWSVPFHCHLPKIESNGSPSKSKQPNQRQSNLFGNLFWQKPIFGNPYWQQPIFGNPWLTFWLNLVQMHSLSNECLLPPIFPAATFEQCLLLGFAFSAGLGPTRTYAALWVSMFGRYKGDT